MVHETNIEYSKDTMADFLSQYQTLPKCYSQNLMYNPIKVMSPYILDIYRK